METRNNKQVVEAYFDAFGHVDAEALARFFHPECKIVSVRESDRVPGQLHGVYKSREEAVDFIQNIQRIFTTKSFEVERIIAQGDLVYANGTFAHEVNASGNIFYSDWVQRCIIEDGMIKEYRFYEDSAAFELAVK